MAHARHILAYAQTVDHGGVERALMRLAAGWAAAGRRVTLVLGEGEAPPDCATVALGDRRQRALLALPRLVRAAAPDILFCPGNHYTGIAGWTRLRLGRAAPPIVAKVSNALVRGDHGRLADRAHGAWLRLQPRFVDAFVAMTPAMAAATVAATGAAAGAVHVIPNPPRIGGGGDAALPAGRVVLGVGRLAPQKRWDRLVAALPALPEDAVLAIVGEGDGAALVAQAAALGVAHRLHLLGPRADPTPAMAVARVVALSSDFEGVPGVLREALAVGTPVVATDSSPAIAEIVAAPALGTIVARDDAGGLAAALRHWLGDAPRPAPVPPPGSDAAARYLDLFDTLALR